MRVKSFYRLLRVISCFVLFFISWSYGQAYAPIAWAVTEARATKGRKTEHSGQVQQKTTEEKFQETLDRIREAGTDRAKLKVERSELETLDAALQKQFQETEEKIKALPDAINLRHRDFVKKYTENLKTLKGHMSRIEKAKTDGEVKAAAGKIRAFLESVKAPSRHQKLDPENLPFRNRKVKAPKAPRLKKEEFEKEFGPQNKAVHSSSFIALNREPQELFYSGIRNKPAPERSNWGKAAIGRKPVMLAYNSTIASDVPLSFGDELQKQDHELSLLPGIACFGSTLNSEPGTMNLAQAQTPDLPSAADLAETLDIQFTDAIRAKARELGGKPVKIYEWVRNNIEYAPLYGSIQGADQCLQSKICNDFDTASLLIALFRVSGISAKYVYGTVDIPIEQAMNWVGGITDPKVAGTIFTTNGVPAILLKTSGSIYKYVRMEHVWVSAFIDYIPSRGAVHRQGDSWIPLDPSYKQFNYTQGIDIRTAVRFDAQAFIDQILSTATTNTTEGYVTNVNSNLVQQTMTDYQKQVQNYIQQNHPNATVGDVTGKKEIKKQVLGILPVTLPYKIVQAGAEFAQVPDSLRATINFSIPDPTGAGAGLSYTTGMPQIAGKKITLSFSPATASDQAIIESFLPAAHSDGTPIQPSELPSSFPAYLINLSPELRIDGQVVSTGSSGIMGDAHSFTMSLSEPGIGISIINNIVQAGEFFGIGLDTGRRSNLGELKTKLEATKAKLVAQNYDGMTKDDVVGDLFYTAIATYFAELDINDEITAKVRNVVRYRALSIGMFSSSLGVQEVFGIPKSAGPKGMMMDVDRIMQAVFSKDGNMDQIKQYMIASGSVSSSLEHAVPEQLYSAPAKPAQGISAVKALQLASSQGIPIYTINQSNIAAALPQLQVSADVKSDIANAVNAGKQVTVSKENITFNGLSFCGYIISDPVTGAGAYMISGGQSGAFIAALLGGILASLGIIFAGPAIALALVIFGLALFLLGVLNIVVNYTQQEWIEFGCYFVMFFTLGLSYPTGLLSAFFQRLLWGLSAVYILDTVANTNFISCNNQP